MLNFSNNETILRIKKPIFLRKIEIFISVHNKKTETKYLLQDIQIQTPKSLNHLKKVKLLIKDLKS